MTSTYLEDLIEFGEDAARQGYLTDDAAFAAHHLRVTVVGDSFRVEAIDDTAHFLMGHGDPVRSATLPSSFLTPTGGTAANAAANGPVQLRYPYAMWLNNNNTGFVGVKMPIEAALDVQFKM